MQIRVQQADFDLQAEQQALRQRCPEAGAVVSFVGLVRELTAQGPLTAMRLEHYPGMTERALQRIVQQAQTRWALAGATVIHRVGTLAPQDQIVLVLVAATHRAAAFAACEFIMDFLKTQAPFWKQECYGDRQCWVEAKDSDEQALARWQLPPGGA